MHVLHADAGRKGKEKPGRMLWTIICRNTSEEAYKELSLSVRLPSLSAVFCKGWGHNSCEVSSIYTADNFHLEATIKQFTLQAGCPSEVKGLQ